MPALATRGLAADQPGKYESISVLASHNNPKSDYSGQNQSRHQNPKQNLNFDKSVD